MDKTILYIVPPLRPENCGMTASEFAAESGYSVDGAHKILRTNPMLASVTMRNKNGLRISVYMRKEEAEADPYYKLWIKNPSS